MTILLPRLGVCHPVAHATWAVALAAATVAAASNDPEVIDHAQSQVDWLKANGGYFNPKIVFRHLDPDDPTSSPSGLFVDGDVAEGEVLMIIPHKCLLKSSEEDETLQSTCDTVRNLVSQYKLGEKSHYWPYVRYVMDDRHRGDLPSEWSKEGKELLESIIPAEALPGFNATDASFVRECEADPNEEEVGPLQEFSHLAVLRRSWDDLMVPVLDMVNHRNGRWTNIESNSAHEGKDIRVYATRDIEAGEQLHISYNECTDCHIDDFSYAHTYTLPYIMKDYGFVEQLPQRWNFDSSWIMFEVDEVVDEDGENTGALEVIWFSDPPEFNGRHFLHGQLRRLQRMYNDVLARAALLESDHEKRVIVNFYDALSTALDVAIISSTAISQEEEEADGSNATCTAEGNGEETCSVSSQPYDDLLEAPYGVDYVLDFCDFSAAHDRERYDVVEEYQSHYQRLTYGYSKKDDDTCLYLDDHLEACSSVRPHYHEVMVHYAAGFLDEVKRVIILGGGDNLLIHEVLKYESLELAVVLELDQVVVRSAYQHFGAHPYWNDDRVKYYFGDAAKSLPMLPREYYGTFDIVFIDLQTWIIELLSLMEVSAKLMKPGGFIMRNEDGGFGTNEGFARHNVDIYTQNIPAWCAQGVTMGSNNIDVFNRPWKPHRNISNIFFRPEQASHFYNWYNYRKNDGICKESDNKMDNDSVQPAGDDKHNASGILMIIEAENMGISLESSLSVASILSGALQKIGFNEVSTRQYPSDPKGSGNGADYTLIHVMSEGYVVARVFPNHKYAALDLMLWGRFDRQEAAKSQIVNAFDIGSSRKRNLVSSYRIVTGGMIGASSWDEDREKLGPPPGRSNPCDLDQITPKRRDGAATQKDVDVALNESLALIRDIDAEGLVVVVCGERSISSSCSAKNIVGKDEGFEVATIVTCPNLSHSEDSIDSSLMYACEVDTLEKLREVVQAENKSVGGVIIDQGVPHAMGQVLNMIFSDVFERSELLETNFAVIAVSSVESGRSPSSPWRRVFMERFRTKIVQIGPAFSADISFDNSDGSSKLGLDVFYANEKKEFYPFLDDIVQRIAIETKLSANIKYVQNGANPYLAEFEPEEVFTDSQYREIQTALSSSNDERASEEEFLHGGQTIFQFVVADERVKANMRLSCIRVQDAARRTLKLVRGGGGSEKIETVVYEDLGEGCIVLSVWSSGTAVLVWNGARGLDVNLFMKGGETMKLHDEFGAYMKKYIPSLHIVLRDDQPRGVGTS